MTPSEIGTSMLTRPAFKAPSAERKNGWTRVGDRRQRDQRRQPVEQALQPRAHVAVPRPHRHRQQHDVHGREARDADAAQQGIVRAFERLDAVDRKIRRLEPHAPQGIDQLDAVDGAVFGQRCHAARGEIGARRNHAGHAHERGLDLAHAAAAHHVRHGQCHTQALRRCLEIQRPLEALSARLVTTVSISAPSTDTRWLLPGLLLVRAINFNGPRAFAEIPAPLLHSAHLPFGWKDRSCWSKAFVAGRPMSVAATSKPIDRAGHC
jgi:hypothetical protein